MSDLNRNVSFVIHHKVKTNALPRYEEWVRMATARAAEAPGHQGVHVIRPTAGGTEYTVIIRWDTFEHAKTWAESPERKAMVEKISDAFESPDRTEINKGIEFWFTPPGQLQKKAPAWKQWLVTTSVIWPLTVIIPPLLKPIFLAAPPLAVWPLGHLVTAAVIVALVTYGIMPYYVKAISGWMFK